MKPMSLADRAATALTRARHAVPDYGDDDPPHIRRRRAQLSRELAATLGVHPADVVASADPIRRHGRHAWHLLTVHDTDQTWRFSPDVADDTTYLLLGPCPLCQAEVPVARITELADLGLLLETTGHAHPSTRCDGPDPRRPGPPRLSAFAEFTTDPGHTPTCPVPTHPTTQPTT